MHRFFIYERLKRSLLEEMASGDWRSGQRFLSVRVIIRRWKVSRPTVCSSLQQLCEEGLLVAASRRGFFLGQGFQEKAQLLLRRNRTPPVQPPLPIEQKARLLRGVRGGRVALLLEAKAAAPQELFPGLPTGVSPSPRDCGRAFLKESRLHGFEVTSFLYDGTSQNAAWLRGQLEQGGFEGAAVFCRSSNPDIQPTLEPLIRQRKPLVIMYDDNQGLPAHSVNLNNVGLGYDAIRALHRAGHRKIIVLLRKAPLKLHLERLKGCCLARDEGGCGDVQLTTLRLGSGTRLDPHAVRHFADPASRPTAVFACESRLLQRAIPVWKQLRLRVPEDLSVIVCSSRSRHAGISVPLDAMQLKVGARIGRIAAQQLQRMQAGEPLEKVILLDVRHMRRGSLKTLEPTATERR